ncbi:MAG: pyroglutamyl-peptidase I [Clostridia bacterium]|jgi:pyroglutamyl-peptidase|nr:pyroglutamyl-peptidase I [Clostridia bacterium]
MKKLIVSAFEPFGGSGRNSSLETLRALPEILYGYEIVKVTLPVVYGECGRLLCGKIAEYDPSEIAAVICLGLASGRGNIMPEYVAVNVRHGASADNAGVKYELTPIGDGADAYVTGLPVSDMVKKMKEAGVPAAVSFTAGTYVCNDLMYAAVEYCRPRGIRAGFVHLPLSLEIAVAEGKAGMVHALPQEMLTRGIVAAIGAV